MNRQIVVQTVEQVIGLIEQRAQAAQAVAREMEEAYLQALVGSTLPVLFEEEKEGR